MGTNLDISAWRGYLENIVRWEDKQVKEFKTKSYWKGMRGLQPWWNWQNVAVPYHIINKLLLAGLLSVSGGRRKHYKLKNRNKVRELIRKSKPKTVAIEKHVRIEKLRIPGDFLSVVEGFDDIKEFLKRSLTAKEPVHILFTGEPGTAKSLMLAEVERLGAKFITGGTSTKVGIRDVIFEDLPRILILDEIDKVSDRRDIAALLTWMESGRIIITKSGVKEERRGKGWVLAACNDITKIAPELKDRFEVFHIAAYTPEQYSRIVTNYLMKRCHVKREVASYIAEKVGEYTTSVREAIRVSRVASTKAQVDRLIPIIRRYSES